MTPRLPILLSIAVSALLVPVRSAAQPSTLDLNLDMRGAPLPDHVCVLTNAQTPRGRALQLDENRALSDIDLTDLRNESRSLPDGNSTKDALKVFEEPHPELPAPKCPASPDDDNGTTVCVSSRSRFCLPESDKPLIEKASSRATEGLSLWCKRNEEGDPASDIKNTLILLLQIAPDGDIEQVIEDLTFRRDLITVQFRRKLGNFKDKRLEILGGSYLETDRVFPIGGSHRVVLPIYPRCGKHEVKLMPMKTLVRNKRVSVTVEFKDRGSNDAQCCNVEVDAKGRFETYVPYAANRDGRERKTLTCTVKERGARAPDRAVFEAEWYETMPPKVIRTHMSQVSFYWRRHCLYPQETGAAGNRGFGGGRARCPDAALSEVGLDCRARFNRRDNTCLYVCGGDKGREKVSARFHIPTAVTFSRPGTTDTWSESLRYVGQTLSGYVRPEDRQLAVDFSAWNADDPQSLTRVPGDRIDYIQVRSPKGDVHRIKVRQTGEQRVKVPWVRCEDVLAYRNVGRRTYREDTLLVEDGGIALPHPERTAQKWGWALMTGGGYNTSWTKKDDRSPFSRNPHGWIKAALTYRPIGRTLGRLPLWFEVASINASVSSKRYRTTVPSSVNNLNEKKNKTDAVVFARWMIGSEAMLTLARTVATGIGVGWMLGHAVQAKDGKKIGLTDNAFGFWNDYIFQLTDRLSLMLTFRMHIGEETRLWRTDFHNKPKAEEGDLIPALFLEAGIRYEGL